MNVKKALTCTLIAYLAFLSIAYAAYTIYSNTVTVTVSDFTLAVDKNNPVKNDVISFNGQTSPSKLVTLYKSPDQLAWQAINTTTSDATGNFAMSYNVTEAGTWYFRAGVSMP